MKSEIASNVKSIIKDKGMLQKAVAKRAGYAPNVFNNMLNGRKTITDSDVKCIAIALQVEPNELFGLKSANENQAS